MSLPIASASRAATLLFAQGEPGEPLTGGMQRVLTEADGSFQASSADPGRVDVTFLGNGPSFWILTFEAPAGEDLMPATYDGAMRFAGPGTPGLDVGADGTGCNVASGRFVVHEVILGMSGEVLAFAADFEHFCDGSTAALTGAIRYRSGDDGCTGVPDTTPCDDHDPCTSGDACLGSACIGSDTVTPGCGVPAPCQLAGVCAPMTGECTTYPAPDGAGCEDGDLCTEGDTCDAGACTSGAAAECDDGDPCTTDACDPVTGCVHESIDGACWATRSILRVVASASAFGRSARCSAKCEVPGLGTLFLFDDGTYRIPSGQLAACPSGSTTAFPDEEGTVRTRRRKVVFEPANLDALFAAAAECVGETNPFRKYRARVKRSRDGTTFRGTATLRGRVPGRIPVRLKVVSKLTGADVASGLEPPPPSRKPLEECTAELALRCRTK